MSALDKFVGYCGKLQDGAGHLQGELWNSAGNKGWGAHFLSVGVFCGGFWLLWEVVRICGPPYCVWILISSWGEVLAGKVRPPQSPVILAHCFDQNFCMKSQRCALCVFVSFVGCLMWKEDENFLLKSWNVCCVQVAR